MKTKTNINLLRELSPTKFFIIIAALFGIFFLFFTPPFETPDEAVHFYRAYQVSEGNFVIDHVRGVNGGYLPISLAKTVDLTTQSSNIAFHPDVKYNLHATKAALSIKEQSHNRHLYDLSSTASYSAVAYAPQAMGILLGRMLQLPPILSMYLGRLMNLLAWVLLGAIAIRFMPYKKWALAAICLLPMVIFQSISLGVDVMVIGLSAILLALTLRLRQRPGGVSRNSLLFTGLISVALVLTKPVMFVLLPILLLIPTSKFAPGRKGYLKKLALLALPLVFFLGWIILTKNLSQASSPSSFNPQPSSQVEFILHDPLGYLLVLWKTYFFTNSDGIARSFIGNFGWVDTPISEFFATLGYGLLAFLILGSSAPIKERLARKDKLILAGTVLLYWLAVTTALYVYYSPVRYKSVIGIQGRYFVPLAILLIPLTRGSWLRVSRKSYQHIAIIGPVLMLTVSAITLFYRYYVHA